MTTKRDFSRPKSENDTKLGKRQREATLSKSKKLSIEPTNDKRQRASGVGSTRKNTSDEDNSSRVCTRDDENSRNNRTVSGAGENSYSGDSDDDSRERR